MVGSHSISVIWYRAEFQNSHTGFLFGKEYNLVIRKIAIKRKTHFYRWYLQRGIGESNIFIIHHSGLLPDVFCLGYQSLRDPKSSDNLPESGV